MSEILDELPRLSFSERRQLSRHLNALDAELEEIASADASALAGAQMLDAMEAEDEHCAQRS